PVQSPFPVKPTRETALKVLLLNLPWTRNLQRDHHCSVTSKTAGNYWPPLDLLLPSGSLAKRHEVRVIDAMAERYSAGEALRKVSEFSPDAMVALSSVLSVEADLRFLSECKQATGCKIVVTGDIYYFRPQVMLQSQAIDAVCRQYPAAGL